MDTRTLKQFSKLLANAKTSNEFFQIIFDRVETLMRYTVEMENGLIRRVVFFGESYTVGLGKIILNSPNAHQYFSTLCELRIVATGINRDLAAKFKKLNPRMHIVWMSPEEWVDRPVESPDPSSLSEPAPADPEHVL